MWIWQQKLTYKFLFLIESDFIVFTIIPPLLYYFTSFLPIKIKWSYKKLIHFSPTLIPLLNYIQFQSKPYNEKIKFINDAYIKYPIECLLLCILFTSLWIFYLLLSLKKVNNYQKISNNTISNIDNNVTKWLIHYIIFFLIIIFTVGIFLNISSSNKLNEIIGTLTMTIMYIFLFYKTITQPNAIQYNMNLSNQNIEINNASKYSINEHEINSYYEKINHYMIEHKPYLQSRLTINDLAKQLNIKSYLISYVINKKTNNNFFYYINNYRVEETKKMLFDEKYKNYSIEAIGKECGFNSTSSFFEVFKKYTNQTPLQFIKNNTPI